MVVVATKFHQICPRISENAEHLYKSPKAQSAADSISNFFGITSKHVLPVLNYVDERETNEWKDKLALQAMYEMIKLIKDHFQTHRGMAQIIDEWEERERMLPSLKDTNDKKDIPMQLHEMLELLDKKLRVLVVGPTKSGKSSFIDSISSTLRADIVNKAAGERMASGGSEGVSLTEKFQMYPVKYKHKSDRLKSSNVSFGDIPGFQESGGITVEHVKYILKGHVQNKYEIQNGIEKSSKGFIKDPNKQKSINCVCVVFDCKSLNEGLSEKIKATIDKLLNVVSKEGIPYIVILTKGDKVNEAVKTAKRRVFASREVKECKDKLMSIFNLRQNIIFPVINYVNENKVDPQADALLIAAFREILKKGMEFLEESDEESE